MTKVKICGITNLEDARHALEYGADILGFNFCRESSRYVDEGYVESIVERLVHPVKKAGVFVNENISEIVDIEGIAELDILQLHGEETPDFVARLREETDAEIIKAVRIKPDLDPAILEDYEVDGILLDAYSGEHQRGGTGMTFNWEIVKTLTINSPLYLAGGLTPHNVVDAIRTVRPFAVDVASGVESSPGKKDLKKLEAFIRNAKNA